MDFIIFLRRSQSPSRFFVKNTLLIKFYKIFFYFSPDSRRTPVLRFRRVRRVFGETDAEGRTLSELTLHGKRPTRLFADLFDDGESETESAVFSAVRFVHREKTVENPFEIFLRDPDSRIRNAELRLCEPLHRSPFHLYALLKYF